LNCCRVHKEPASEPILNHLNPISNFCKVNFNINFPYKPMLTRLQAGRPRFDSWQGLRHFLLVTPPNLLSSGYRASFTRGWSGRSLKLKTYLHLAILPLPQYVFMALYLI